MPPPPAAVKGVWREFCAASTNQELDLNFWVPIVVHGDDGDSHRRRSFCVVTMGSAVVNGSPFDCKFLLYAVDNTRTCPESFDTLDAWVVWNLVEMQSGRFLTVDPWNKPIQRPTGSVAGKYRGGLVNLEGDEKYLQRCLKLKSSWVSQNVCPVCKPPRPVR